MLPSKNKLILIMGGTIIALIASLTFAQKRIQTLKIDRDQAIAFNNARADSLERYKNKYGIVVSRAEVLDLSLRNMQKMREDERLFWLREFESLNKRLNNVEQASRVTAEIVGNFKIPIQEVPIYRGDSLFQVRTFDNEDPWLRVSGVILKDSIEVIPNVKLDIKTVFLWERKKFLGLKIGRKEFYAEVLTDNPYATIRSVEVTRVSRRRP